MNKDIEKKLSSALKELSERRTNRKLYTKGFNERTKRLLIKTFGKSATNVRIKDISGGNNE